MSVNPPADSTLPAEVLDVTWQWVNLTTPMEEVRVDAPDRYTVQFGRDGRVAVRADCNQGSASYSVSAARHLVLGPLVLTRMACPALSLSDRFAKELARVETYSLKDGELYLELPKDAGALRFRRQP
jgi:heat shock protein HslJ